MSTWLGTALGIKHAFRAMRPGRNAGSGWRDREHRLGRGHDRLPGDRRILSIQVGGRPSHQGRRGGIRPAGVRRPREHSSAQASCPNAMGAQLAVDMERLGLFPSVDEAVGAVVSLTPSGRLATEDDIANGVAFLLSDDAAFINGVTLSIDGAMGM